MTSKEAQELARLLAKMPGIKSVELKDVRKLVELLQEFPEVGSIEVKGIFDTGVVVTRTGSSSTAAPGVPFALPPVGHQVAGASSAGPAAPAAPAQAPSSLKDIKSPMVGTFYRSPEPGAEPYVKVGTRVTTGQTVCIIEAMKIMNEIEAEVSGTVREICVEDAQPVEFGQVLYRIDPHG